MARRVGYSFSCRRCGGPNRRAFNFCPWCGIDVKEPTKSVNGRRFTIDSFRLLMQPIVNLHGYTWVANRIGVDESSIRHVLIRQKFTVSERVAEKWLIPLGIENALYDGTLKTFVPEPPASKYFEE